MSHLNAQCWKRQRMRNAEHNWGMGWRVGDKDMLLLGHVGRSLMGREGITRRLREWNEGFWAVGSCTFEVRFVVQGGGLRTMSMSGWLFLFVHAVGLQPRNFDCGGDVYTSGVRAVPNVLFCFLCTYTYTMVASIKTISKAYHHLYKYIASGLWVYAFWQATMGIDR